MLVFFIASKYINIEEFSHYIILWFYLGTVYQTMRRSYYNRRASQKQTDLLLLIKINNVTSNVSRPKPRKANKLERFITSSPFIVHILEVRISLETK